MKAQAGPCAELGLQQPVIAGHTLGDNIAKGGTVLDPANCLGQSGVMVDRMLARLAW